MNVDDESAGYFPELIVNFAVKFYRYPAEFWEFSEENVFQLSFLCQLCDWKIGQFFAQSRFFLSFYNFNLAYFAVFRFDRFFALGQTFFFLCFFELCKPLLFSQTFFFFGFFKFGKPFFFG